MIFKPNSLTGCGYPLTLMSTVAIMLAVWGGTVSAEGRGSDRLQEWGFEPPLQGSLSIGPDFAVKYPRGETYFTKPIKIGELCSVLVLQLKKPLSGDASDFTELAPQMSTHYGQVEKSGACPKFSPDAPGIQAASLLQAIGAFKETRELIEEMKGKDYTFKLECAEAMLCPRGRPGTAFVMLLNPAFLGYASLSPLLGGHDTDEMVFVAPDEKGIVKAVYIEAHRTFPDPASSFRGRLTELDVTIISLPQYIF